MNHPIDGRTSDQLFRAYEKARDAGDKDQESSLWRAYVAKQAEEMAQRDIRRARVAA